MQEALLQDYQAVRKEARDIIAAFYHKNNGFPKPSDTEVQQLKKSYSSIPYRFKYVVAKYFFNVTFEYKKFPWRYLLPVFYFYMGKKWGPSYRKTIHHYRQDLTSRLVAFSKKHPEISFDEDAVCQIMKVILACYITTFINLPLLSFKLRREKLHYAYVAGFYYGLAYIISDKTLDNPHLQLAEKEQFHQQILSALSDESASDVSNDLLRDVIQMARQELPTDLFESQYRLLFFLQCVQFEEYFYNIETGSDDELIDKITLSALKTHLSLYTIQSFSTRFSLTETIQKHIKYSLLVQQDDDLRDVEKDKKENIKTFFSQPWNHPRFSPHVLYLALVKELCAENKHLVWLFTDYFKHLSKKEDETGLDHEKIMVFIQKVAGFDPKELVKTIH